MASDFDTIAAVATGPAPGAIGIVRVSGSASFGIVSYLLRGSRFSPSSAVSHHVYHGYVHDPATGEPIDEVLLLVFREPHSYTGEDVVEISCHGGPYVLSRVLEATIAAGARHAEPGEFTMRAYLRGRMDLAQAEAVADIIEARSEGALRCAIRQREGGLSKRVASMRATLLAACAGAEAMLEYDDDEDDTPRLSEVLQNVHDVAAEVASLYRTFDLGRVLRRGYRVAIVGRPNVGKSTLLNALAGRERALVTAIPGTTRDIVEETVSLGGMAVTFLDTAGLRKPRGSVEAAGVQRTRDTAALADGVLVVLDASRGWRPQDQQVLESAGERCIAVLWNKTDTVPPQRAHALAQHPALREVHVPVLAVSAAKGTGLEDLHRTIMSHIAKATSLPEDELVTNERHARALHEAHHRINSALARLQDGDEPVLAAADLRDAADALGVILGATTPEDVIHEIFSRFCVGK